MNGRTLIVAEIGNNHEGRLDAALQLLSAAADSGADAVKFQAIDPERLVSQDEPSRLAQLKELCLTRDDLERVFGEAAALGVRCFATPFDVDMARWLRPRQDIFKVSSGDNDFWQLISEVASYGVPTMISTGLAVAEDVDALVDRWSGLSPNGTADLTLLHCVTSYPVPVDEANLRSILSLKAEYPLVRVGYSDHCLGIRACIAAVALGANVIEKHFTLSHETSSFRDHVLSAEPAEFAAMVSAVREVERMLGPGGVRVEECESPALESARRSVAAARNLAEGSVLQDDDITLLRPRRESSIVQPKDALGRRVRAPIDCGRLISQHDVQQEKLQP